MTIIKNESERKYRSDILESDPDAALRDEISKRPNGVYTFEICKKCNEYYYNPDGCISTAKIVDTCRCCFRDVGP